MERQADLPFPTGWVRLPCRLDHLYWVIRGSAQPLPFASKLT